MGWGDTRSSNGNKYWAAPSSESTQWRAPGSDRMFHDRDAVEDNPGRMFTVRKRHGWWGREEYFDARGRKVS